VEDVVLDQEEGPVEESETGNETVEPSALIESQVEDPSEDF